MCATSPFVPGATQALFSFAKTQTENKYIYLSGDTPVTHTLDDNGNLVDERLVILTALSAIVDDPLVGNLNFLDDVILLHHAMAERIGVFLLPNVYWSDRPRFKVFEDNGYLVFRNPATSYWHLRTRKGDLVYRTRFN